MQIIFHGLEIWVLDNKLCIESFYKFINFNTQKSWFGQNMFTFFYLQIDEK